MDVLVGHLCQLAPPGGREVLRHALVVREDRGRGAELGAHVGDGRLAGRADRAGARTKVLDDGVGAARDGQLAGQLEDHVFGGGPAAHLTRQVHADELRVEHLPGQARHHLDGVSAAHADGARPQASGVRGVRVGADDELAGEGVLLQGDLVDDAGPRSPEADPVLGSGRAEELVDLLVLCQRLAQVGLAGHSGLNQVVTVNAGGHGGPGAARLHELEHGCLAQHVLEDHAVGPQLDVRLAALHPSRGWIVEVRQQHFVGQPQRTSQVLAHDLQGAVHPPIDTRYEFGRGLYRHHDLALLRLGAATTEWPRQCCIPSGPSNAWMALGASIVVRDIAPKYPRCPERTLRSCRPFGATPSTHDAVAVGRPVMASLAQVGGGFRSVRDCRFPDRKAVRDRQAFERFLSSAHSVRLSVEYRGEVQPREHVSYRWLRWELVHERGLPVDIAFVPDHPPGPLSVRAGGAPNLVLQLSYGWLQHLVGAVVRARENDLWSEPSQYVSSRRDLRGQ